MRRIITGFMFLFLIALFACSEKVSINGPIKVTASREALEVETDQAGDQKSFNLKVENISDAPVDLTEGCFVLAGLDKYEVAASSVALQRTLLPGEAIEGIVTFVGPKSISSASEVKFSASCSN